MDRRLITLLFVLCLNVLAAAAAFAQSGTSTPADAAPPKPPPGFGPIAGKTTDTVNPSPLVVGAYAAFFVGMFGYVVYVVRRQSEMAKEMAELAARIDRAEKK